MRDLRSFHPIGIDIGDRYVYAAQLKPDSGGYAVRGLWRKEYDQFTQGLPNEDEGLVSVLKGIRRSRRFQGRSAAIHIPDEALVSTPVSFQLKPDESVEEGLFREIEDHVPFPIEDAILDYPSISERKTGDQTSYSAIVVAARRESIHRYITILKKAGLTVEAIDSGISSLIRLHDLANDACVNTNILCHIGYKQSLLTIVIEDYVLAQRPFTWGFQTLLDKINANLELPADKATFLMNKYGLGYEDVKGAEERPDKDTDGAILDLHRALYQIVTPYVDELIYEFHTITSYVRAEPRHSSFEGIYMYGCANMMHFLDSYLEKRINIPVGILNPLSKMKTTASHTPAPTDITEGAPYGLALGLATRKVSWL